MHASWRRVLRSPQMTSGNIVEGVFAINKPQSISSAQVLRDLQSHFNTSTLFAPWLDAERSRRHQESRHQKKRRRDRGPLQVKIGHGGTLDPLATGVLIAGVGRGTKELQGFLECTKTYEATVLFGVATDSYDRVGKVLGHAPYEHITKEKVEEALKKFRGQIMQRPPIYSALRVQGKRLYEYAREGKEVPVEIQARPVAVEELELTEWFEGGSHPYEWPTEEAAAEEKQVAKKVLHNENIDSGVSTSADTGDKRGHEEDKGDYDEADAEPASKKSKPDPEQPPEEPSEEPPSEAKTSPDKNQAPAKVHTPPACKLRMTVTSGFYVRSLCHDLGEALGSLAIMSELVRTRQGDFELGKNVLEYDDLAKGEDDWGPKVEDMLNSWDQKHS